MADVWVLRRIPETDDRVVRSALIRTDALRHLEANEYEVTLHEPGAEPVVLADSEGGNHLLPFDFHVELLASIARARKGAQDGEDQVVIAERDSSNEWVWKAYRLSELT
ncbi:hypothetical protein ACWGCI_23250 [Streptomyces sp. NPDC054949]